MATWNSGKRGEKLYPQVPAGASLVSDKCTGVYGTGDYILAVPFHPMPQTPKMLHRPTKHAQHESKSGLGRVHRTVPFPTPSGTDSTPLRPAPIYLPVSISLRRSALFFSRSVRAAWRTNAESSWWTTRLSRSRRDAAGISMIPSAFTAAHRTESLECSPEIAPTVRFECRDKLANFRRRLKRKSNGRHRADGNRHDGSNRDSLGNA